MVWLDDSSFRDSRWCFERTSGSPTKKTPVSAQRQGISVARAEAENSANSTLLEGQFDRQGETQRLLADITSLERAVRKQKKQRVELEAKLVQQAADHVNQLSGANEASQLVFDQLRREHDREKRQLQNRLTKAERLARQREGWFGESVLAAKQLRKMLTSTEQGVSQRDCELRELQSQLDTDQQEYAEKLSEAQHQHAIESKYLQAIASSAESRSVEHKERTVKLESDLKLLREENEHYQRQNAEVSREKSLAENSLGRSERDHAIEVGELKAEIAHMQIELQRLASEKTVLDANAVRVEAEQSTKIDEIEQHLRVAEQKLFQSETVARQQQQRGAELQVVVGLLEEEAVALKVAHQSEIAALKQSLITQQAAAIDQARQSETVARQQQQHADELQIVVGLLEEDAAAQNSNHNREVAKLRESLEQHRSDHEQLVNDHEQLVNEHEQTSRDLDRKVGALERLRLENERLQEIVDTQLPPFQSRVDELIVALDSERAKRTGAEQEARRLSCSRSERIALLGQQRGRLVAERGRMREDNLRLGDQVVRVRAIAETAKRWLKDATDGLIEQSKSYEHVQLAIAQRDRTIERLEQDSLRSQERLQREAAARRKAEGALKREAKAVGLDTAVHYAWSLIDAQDQVERLKKHVKALRSVNMLQRQKSTADVLRYKTEVQQLKRNVSKRAA